MKSSKLYLIGIFLTVLALLIPLALRAQSPDRRVPPPPPPLPGERSKNFQEQGASLGPNNTPTPNPIEAQNLPKAKSPEKKPSLEIVDTAPNVPYENKYHIIVERGQDKKRVGIAVPLNIKPEEAIQKFLQADDKFLYVSMPMSPKGKLLDGVTQ